MQSTHHQWRICFTMKNLIKTKKGKKYGALVRFSPDYVIQYLIADEGNISSFGKEPEPSLVMINMMTYEVFSVPLRVLDGLNLDVCMKIEGWMNLELAKILYDPSK